MQMLHLLWHLKNKKQEKKKKNKSCTENILFLLTANTFCPVTMEIAQTVGVL